MKISLKICRAFAILFLALLLGPLVKFVLKNQLEIVNIPEGLKVNSNFENEAVIELYGADAGHWQSYFSLHTWIALKKKNEDAFTIYEVLRERSLQGLPTVDIWKGDPNRPWAGNKPYRLFHLSGKEAEELIPEIERVVAEYPFQGIYTIWPGPNCNTFIAYIGRSIPKLGFTLPPNAVGKDYLPKGVFFSRAPSCTGYQFSFFGIFGVTLAVKEGLEFDVLGLNFGFEPSHFTLLVPGIGKIPFAITQ